MGIKDIIAGAKSKAAAMPTPVSRALSFSGEVGQRVDAAKAMTPPTRPTTTLPAGIRGVVQQRSMGSLPGAQPMMRVSIPHPGGPMPMAPARTEPIYANPRYKGNGGAAGGGMGGGSNAGNSGGR